MEPRPAGEVISAISLPHLKSAAKSHQLQRTLKNSEEGVAVTGFHWVSCFHRRKGLLFVFSVFSPCFPGFKRMSSRMLMQKEGGGLFLRFFPNCQMHPPIHREQRRLRGDFCGTLRNCIV